MKGQQPGWREGDASVWTPKSSSQIVEETVGPQKPSVSNAQCGKNAWNTR